jgi:hypothetical protein
VIFYGAIVKSESAEITKIKFETVEIALTGLGLVLLFLALYTSHERRVSRTYGVPVVN